MKLLIAIVSCQSAFNEEEKDELNKVKLAIVVKEEKQKQH